MSITMAEATLASLPDGASASDLVAQMKLDRTLVSSRPQDPRLRRLADAHPCKRCGFLTAIQPGNRLVHILDNGDYSTVGCRAATFDRSCLERGDDDGDWDDSIDPRWKAS